MISIQLPAEALITIGPITVTNAMAATMLVTVLLSLFALWFNKTLTFIPSKTQLVFETMQQFWLKQLRSAYGDEEVAQYLAPLFLTLFVLLVAANQFALIPLAGAILFKDSPLFRTPTSDLSHTFALALLMVGFAHLIALSLHPLQHLGNYIKLKPLLTARSGKDLGNAFLELFLGVLDIIGELAKLLSLSGRLFGNLFAGDVMILVIASLSAATYYLVPIPFLFLSLFSGFVQAAVFTMLTMLFLAGTSSVHLKERLHQPKGKK